MISNEVIEALVPLAKRVANGFCTRYRVPHCVRDEYISAAQEALVVEMRKYDPARWSKGLEAYARIVVWYDLLDHLRNHLRSPKFNIRRLPATLPDGDWWHPTEHPTPEIGIDLRRALGRLRKKEASILRACLLECRQTELGARIGRSRSHVSRNLSRARAFIRAST
jgi:RNA polymerase sigma factor (sigma-70 family)